MRLIRLHGSMAGIVLVGAISIFFLTGVSSGVPAGTPHLASTAQGNGASDEHPITLAETRALYARFKKFAGVWEGKSTKGWTERETVRVIAGESAVLFDSFDAHPNETMLTLIHMDGSRLLLTHYCVAKNQPRLAATSVSADGKSATFTFLDATNLASRDVGHMDKAVFNFDDDDHYTSQWTWYEKGREDWMERIVSRRLPDPAIIAH